MITHIVSSSATALPMTVLGIWTDSCLRCVVCPCHYDDQISHDSLHNLVADIPNIITDNFDCVVLHVLMMTTMET